MYEMQLPGKSILNCFATVDIAVMFTKSFKISLLHLHHGICLRQISDLYGMVLMLPQRVESEEELPAFPKISNRKHHWQEKLVFLPKSVNSEWQLKPSLRSNSINTIILGVRILLRIKSYMPIKKKKKIVYGLYKMCTLPDS